MSWSPPLLDLVDQRLIRIIDALIIVKHEEGDVDALSTSDLDTRQVGDLGQLAGASSGLLSEEDAAEAAALMGANSIRRARRLTEGELMPGLLRGMARTAVVAGTATGVSNRVSRRQANRWARDDQSLDAPSPYAAPPPTPPQYAPPAPSSHSDEMFEQLRQLGGLRDKGILTDEEFAAQKSRILSS